MIHVELGIDGERVALVGDRRVDHLKHERAFAGMSGQGNEGITQRCVLGSRGHLAERHQRTATAVAEQHRLGSAATELGNGGLHIDDGVGV